MADRLTGSNCDNGPRSLAKDLMVWNVTDYEQQIPKK